MKVGHPKDSNHCQETICLQNFKTSGYIDIKFQHTEYVNHSLDS